MANRKTEIHKQSIVTIREEGLKMPGVARFMPSMILAVCCNAATQVLKFVIDKAGLYANQKGTYNQIEAGEGARVQYTAVLSGDYGLIAGARGFIAALGNAARALIECFARLIDQTTGSAIGNMFFTPIGEGYTFETALVNRRTGQITDLLALGFTQVVAVPVLGGLVGVRADDPVSNRNRQLYFLPLAKLADGECSTENWTASNPLGIEIQGLPWRVTAQNIGQVLVRTPNGFECVDLRNLGKGQIVSLAEQAINTTNIGQVLGETMDPSQVVVADRQGNTHFVLAQSLRAAVEQVQKEQSPV